MDIEVKPAKLKLKWSKEERQEIGKDIAVTTTSGPSSHAYFVVSIPFTSAREKPFADLLSRHGKELARKKRPFYSKEVPAESLSPLERIGGKQLSERWILASVRFALQATPTRARFLFRADPRKGKRGLVPVRALPPIEDILSWIEQFGQREAEAGLEEIVARLSVELRVLEANTELYCSDLVVRAVTDELKPHRERLLSDREFRKQAEEILADAASQIKALVSDYDKKLPLEMSLTGAPSKGKLEEAQNVLKYHNRPSFVSREEVDESFPALLVKVKEFLASVENGEATPPLPSGTVTVKLRSLADFTVSL